MDQKPDGHDEAMRNLIASTSEDETDFTTWHERFKAKKAAQEAKEAALNDGGVVSSHWAETLDGVVSDSLVSVSSSCGRSSSTKSWLLPFDFSRVSFSGESKKSSKKDPYKPIRMEIYSPPDELAIEAERRGLKFTVGKAYPIFADVLETHRYGTRYITQDDEGNRRSINSVHFNQEDKLQWTDLVEDKWLSLAIKNWHENNDWRVALPIADKTIESDTSIEQV